MAPLREDCNIVGATSAHFITFTLSHPEAEGQHCLIIRGSKDGRGAVHIIPAAQPEAAPKAASEAGGGLTQ